MPRFESGYWVVARWKRIPIRLHWTTPIGAFVFSRFSFVPGFWLAWVWLILMHELGHATIVLAQRKKVLSVDVHGMGGLCTWSGETTRFGRALIAWGGVIAQAIVYVGARLYVATHPDRGTFENDALWAFLDTNLWVIAINLIPVAPLDGAEAWKILQFLPARLRGSREHRDLLKKADEAIRHARQLDSIDGDRPPPEVSALVDKILSDAKAGPKKPQ